MRQQIVTLTDASGGAKSAVVPLNIHGWPNVAVQIDVTGTVNWTLQQTLNDPNTTTPLWFNSPDANFVAQIVTRQGNYTFLPAALKLILNSGTGTVVMTVLQAGSNLS